MRQTTPCSLIHSAACRMAMTLCQVVRGPLLRLRFRQASLAVSLRVTSCRGRMTTSHRGLTLPWIQDSNTFGKLHRPGPGHVEICQAPPPDDAGVAGQGVSPLVSVGQTDLRDVQDSCSTGLGAQQGLPKGQVCMQCCSAFRDGAEQGQGAGQAGVQARGAHAIRGDGQGSPKVRQERRTMAARQEFLKVCPVTRCISQVKAIVRRRCQDSGEQEEVGTHRVPKEGCSPR